MFRTYASRLINRVRESTTSIKMTAAMRGQEGPGFPSARASPAEPSEVTRSCLLPPGVRGLQLGRLVVDFLEQRVRLERLLPLLPQHQAALAVSDLAEPAVTLPTAALKSKR